MNKIKYNYLIVDDEILGRENLKILIQRNDTNCGNILTCSTINEAINILNNNNIDILFLDIMLKNEFGFDLLKKHHIKDIPLIIVSASDQYGIIAIKHGVVDYLLKPYNSEELIDGINKAKYFISTKTEKEKNILNNNYKLKINTTSGFLVLDINNIIRLESDGNYTIIKYENETNNIQTYIVSKNLKIIEKQIENNSFIRVHRSHLLNLKYIYEYKSNNYIKLKNGEQIKISRYKIKEIKKLFNKTNTTNDA